MTATPFWLSRSILLTLAGSHAYGTATPESDTDLRGVCIPPADRLLGLHQWDGHQSKEGADPDIAVYPVGKFCRLALQANPNILEILWTPEDCVLQVNAFGRELLGLRDAFLSRRVHRTFGHYAFNKLRKFSEDHLAGKPDWKDAAHLCRLLLTGNEVLRSGQVNVRRADADWLLLVRQGYYSLDYLEGFATSGLASLDAALADSPLPAEPDEAKVDAWLIDVQRRSLAWETGSEGTSDPPAQLPRPEGE